jgi:hypothetical protein
MPQLPPYDKAVRARHRQETKAWSMPTSSSAEKIGTFVQDAPTGPMGEGAIVAL